MHKKVFIIFVLWLTTWPMGALLMVMPIEPVWCYMMFSVPSILVSMCFFGMVFFQVLGVYEFMNLPAATQARVASLQDNLMEGALDFAHEYYKPEFQVMPRKERKSGE